jgi:hypothetical protein
MHNKLAVTFDGDHIHVIADAQGMASFIETVLINRGLPGKLFSSVDDAEK